MQKTCNTTNFLHNSPLSKKAQLQENWINLIIWQLTKVQYLISVAIIVNLASCDKLYSLEPSFQQAWLVLHFRIVAGNNLMTLMWSACRLRDSCGHCAEYAKTSCTFFHLDGWLITGHKRNVHRSNYED